MSNKILLNNISNFPVSVGPEVTVDGWEYEGESLNLITEEKWDTNFPAIPVSVAATSAVILNNEIHILGNNSSGTIAAKDNFHYKWDGSSWTLVSTAQPSYINSRCSTVVYNDEIHLIGGYSTNDIKKHYKWNGSSWTLVSTLPVDILRNYRGAVVYNNEIHIFTETKHYKWNGSSWTSVSTLPVDFKVVNFSASAIVFNNEIHIIGDPRSGVFHYKWNGSSWTFVSTPPIAWDAYTQPNESHIEVVYNNELHLCTLNDHYKWNGSSWASVSTLENFNFSTGSGLTYDNDLHIFQGNDHVVYKKRYKKVG